MIKKLLFTILLVFSISMMGQISITTTSSSTNWSPNTVSNSGAILTWSAAPIGLYPGETIIDDDPEFDFSSNLNNDPIIITVSNTGNDFSGLTVLDLNGANDSEDISDIDISEAIALTLLNLNYSKIISLDLSGNTELENLSLRGNRRMVNYTLDTSTNTKLNYIIMDGSYINGVDFSTNTALDRVHINNCYLTGTVLDQVVNDLNNHGLFDGELDIANNNGQLSSNSYTAYNNLIANGWDLDVPSPPSSPDTKTIVLTTTTKSSAWKLDRIRNYGLIFHWEATNTAIGTIIFDENSPTFDFSQNVNEDPITITITSNDGFVDFEEMSLYDIASPGNDVESKITDIDITNAVNIERFYPNHSSLGELDVTHNLELKDLYIHSTKFKQLIDQTNNDFDISQNLNLERIRLEKTYINSLDVTNNDLLYCLDLRNSDFTSNALDQILIDLDQNGLANPPNLSSGWPFNIMIYGNLSLTSASYTAYNNLISKGWTIDVPAPPAAPGPDIDVTGLGVSIPGNGTNTPDTTDDTDFGQVASGGTITKTFTIENLGDQILDLTGNPDLVSISGANPTEFAISVAPTTPILVNGNTTFKVTFNANSLGTRTAILTIESNDPDEASYFFNIEAEATQASGPVVNVTGNDISIPNGNTPIIADGTDFGQVAIGSPEIKTFTIENLGDSDLIITNGAFFNGGDYFSSPSLPGFPAFSTTISSGSSFDLIVTFDPVSTGIQNISIGFNTNDTNEDPYIINLTAEGVASLDVPEIAVEGNGQPIINEDFNPVLGNDTDFGQVINGNTDTNTYTIYNNGTGDLTVSSISFIGSTSEFVVSGVSESLPFDIAPGGNITFDIDFTPSSSGIYDNVTVRINHSDLVDNLFLFGIGGEGVDAPDIQDIMITQYYEGINNNKWIEVRNISGAPIAAGTYYLALFNDQVARQGIIETSIPTENVAIPALGVGTVPGDEVILFRNSGAALPGPGNIGVATQVVTDVCTFGQGDDVVLISTTNNITCYNNRVDIFGNISSSPSLSPDKLASPGSFIKGGCSSEMAHRDFDIADWTSTSTNEVKDANSDTNLALGTQVIGPTEFDGTSWSNKTSDRSRTAIFSQSFTNANETIYACNLIVNNSVNAVFNDDTPNTNNSIVVYQDLIVNGSLTIGDTESLVTYSNNASIGPITKIEKSNTVYNLHDNTYWSSPVNSAQLSTVFNGVDPNRIFDYRSGDVNPLYAGTNYRYWWKSVGAMERGRGYAVEGPAAPVDGNDDYITPFQHTISFTGIPYNGSIQKDIEFNGILDEELENENFNLVGNPYPAAINLDLFLAGNGGVDHIALWTHATEISGGTGGEFTDEDYVFYNRFGSNTPITNNLASSQGFMVRAIADGAIQFLNSYKIVGSNNQFFKSEVQKKGAIVKHDENDRIWLRLKGGSVKSDILVGFSEEATDELDHYFDSQDGLNDKNVQLYSNLDNQKLVIQGMGSFNSEKSISLGYDTKTQGSLIISMLKREGVLKDTEIYLVDKLLGITHNITLSDYEFEQNSIGEFPDRFKLEFVNNNIDIEDLVDLDKFEVFNDFDIMKVESGKSVIEIKVFDLLGRMIIQKAPKQRSFQLNTSTVKIGTIMLIEAKMEDGSLINTKSIKY